MACPPSFWLASPHDSFVPVVGKSPREGHDTHYPATVGRIVVCDGPRFIKWGKRSKRHKPKGISMN